MESTSQEKPAHDADVATESSNSSHTSQNYVSDSSRTPRNQSESSRIERNQSESSRIERNQSESSRIERERRPFPGQQIKRNTAPRSRRPADNRPKLPNTVYNAVAEFKPADGFGRKDLRKISNIIKTKYHETFGEAEPEKVEQTEYDGKVYQVYCYPEPMRKDIRSVVHWYFKVKKERGTKHERVVKLEGLEKMKRVGSPDYEMALVKFNMAEEERRKQEKLAQAEKVKKDQLRAKYAKDARDKKASGSPRGQYNKDRTRNYRDRQQGNRDGQSYGNNNQYQMRPRHSRPQEFNKENEPLNTKEQREQLDLAAPPHGDVSAFSHTTQGAQPDSSHTPRENTALPPPPIVNEVSNPTPPKPGFLESFLNKIKGKDE